eukprot:2564357-Prymnesium_polylepis.1
MGAPCSRAPRSRSRCGRWRCCPPAPSGGLRVAAPLRPPEARSMRSRALRGTPRVVWRRSV